MKQDNLTDIITDQTERALWEVKNVIDCVPDEYWDKEQRLTPTIFRYGEKRRSMSVP